MDSMATLWEYQIVDMALDRFENKLKKSQTRRKLLKTRNFLLDQQSRMKKLEQSLINGRENCNRIKAEYQRAQLELAKLEEGFKACDKENLSEVRKFSKSYDELNKLLTSMNKDLKKINRLAESTDTSLMDMRDKVSMGKKEFDELKALHDEELKAATPELERLKKEVDRLEPNVDDSLLECYKRVKKSRINPVAKVVNEQCSGCNMAIPSLIMRHLREGSEIIECESCGRILYYIE